MLGCRAWLPDKTKDVLVGATTVCEICLLVEKLAVECAVLTDSLGQMMNTKEKSAPITSSCVPR